MPTGRRLSGAPPACGGQPSAGHWPASLSAPLDRGRPPATRAAAKDGCQRAEPPNAPARWQRPDSSSPDRPAPERSAPRSLLAHFPVPPGRPSRAGSGESSHPWGLRRAAKGGQLQAAAAAGPANPRRAENCPCLLALAGPANPSARGKFPRPLPAVPARPKLPADGKVKAQPRRSVFVGAGPRTETRQTPQGGERDAAGFYAD